MIMAENFRKNLTKRKHIDFERKNIHNFEFQRYS